MLSITRWLDERPYKEIYDGRIHEKVSPKLAHGILQVEIGALLRQFGSQQGKVASEWRFYLDEKTTLLPDVAYVSDDRLVGLSDDEVERPRFAPEIAVEIRSPGDRELNIRRKTELYLAHGAALVINVNPDDRSVRISTVTSERTLHAGDIIEHPAFPGLSIEVAAIFAPLDRPRRPRPLTGMA